MLTQTLAEPDARASLNVVATATSVVDNVGRAASVVLPAGLLVAGFAAAMLTASGAGLGALAVVGLVYGGTVIAASGHLLVLWALERTNSKIALAILLGTVATSLFLTAGCLLSGQSAGRIFVLWSVLVAAVAYRVFRDAPTLDAANPASLGTPTYAANHLSPVYTATVAVPVYSESVANPVYTVNLVDLANPVNAVSPWSRIDHRDVASTAAIGLLVAVWCHRAAGLVPTLRATGLLPIWSDYFIHATEIAQFGDPLAVGRASFLLVDQPLAFYHYASYMLPAAIASLVDLPVLGLATSVLLPYGILLAALGIYAFVKTIANETTALLAPAALLLLPDAASLGFRNGFFGFHWLLLAAPGSGNGLGIAFTALTIMAMWRVDRRAASLCLGLIVTAALFQFRAHVFVLFVPALAMTLLWETDLVRRHVRGVTSAMLMAAVAAAVCLAVVPVAQRAWLQFSAFGPFMELVHTGMSPTAYDGVYQMIEQQYGRASAWTIGFWALIPIALGTLTIALPVALAVAIRRTGWRPLDSFPIWCAVTWLVLVLFAPPFDGAIAEFKHRPFVLVYAAALVWTLLWLSRAIQAVHLARPRSRHVLVFEALVVTVLGVTVATGWNSDPARPQFAWGSQHFGTRLDRGLLEAATFVHTQAIVGDTFVLLPTDRWNRLDDAATRFAAVANVPAYLARPAAHLVRPSVQPIVEQRVAQLEKLEAATNPDVAFDLLRRIGVTFLVVLGQSGPRFDPSQAMADFRAEGAAVYRLPPE